MDKTLISAVIPNAAVVAQHVLPVDGEALLAPKVVFGALGVSESTGWDWVRNDPDFPKPVRRGERYTRFRLSEVRAFIANMAAGKAKLSPAQRRVRDAASNRVPA